MMINRLAMQCLAASILVGALTAAPQASAKECVAPEAIALPLPNLPSTRTTFNHYKSKVKAYQACADEEADPAVASHYERALAQYVALIRRWGSRNRR
jgi:hypothetical protein